MANDSDVSFEGLLAQAKRGVVSASETIYRRYSPRVAAYLRSQQAEDVVGLTNDVFLVVFKEIGTFSGSRSQFRSWLFTIAHRRVIDERRRRHRRMRWSETVPLASVDPAAGDVEEDAMTELADTEVRRILAGLTADQRDVLLLRVVADLPVEEVARALGKAPGAVRGIQHRALATLRRQMARDSVPRPAS